MSRNITAALISAFQGRSVDLFAAVELFFDSGTLRLWTGIGDRTIGGNVYTGSGSLLSISGIEEASDLSARGATVSLSGIDSSLVSLAISEPYQNRVCKIYLGSGGDYFESFSGFMDTMTINDSGDSCEIAIAVESKLIVLERIVPLRYTQETQVQRYPTGTFFSYVTSLADKSIIWGRNGENVKTIIGLPVPKSHK